MNLFKPSQRPTESGGGGNPYLNAREEWLERYGSYISRAAHWRAVAFLCLGVTAVSITGNVLQVMQSKIVPYIIEVDKLGKPSVTSRADTISAPSRRLIQAEIASVINDWRTVTADAELQKKMVTRLSYFTADGAKGLLKQWYTENNPYEIAKSGKLVHVELKGLPLPVSAESYRVEWVETIRSHSGIVLDQQAYEATAAIQILTPTSEVVLLHNPGGIYITALSAAKVIGAPATTKRETP
jgi:type IV secretion system protein VirB5